ncbi:hypothetical protein E3T28_05410 [Cryobacterium sinapicolor]|uniref:Protein-disulfide isomerase n=1 Tax=Cryobacterium sinapicolor TaxID=1259236 RepID=A0ABY2JC33_9MICO|nr:MULTISPECIES: hypothetical protein [Cryobacterium]TFC84148.1 hypothetical protein E3O67_13885 [Cryobacterium sp. TMT3-29-2]TFD02521.1 hypothetical protein E3T28_05410 [Cryobacterium sinapicolor]
MFCIAAFIVLVFMAAVSARYRRYLGKAWNCTLRRVTFRPCDTTFKQDIKDHLLAPLAVRSPKLVGPASVALEVVALLVVLTTVWSAYVVVKSGVNLYVYGTCNKQDSASCSLGAEACSIPDQTPTFGESLLSGDVIGAFGNDFASLGETFSAIPSRMQNWDAEEYLPANASYLTVYDKEKETALEVIDPGCTYCLQLFNNIEEAGFDDRMNLTYIAYPIASADGYKFQNSLLVTQYLEALRLNPLEGAETPVDWEILRRIYTEDDANGVSWQSVLNGAEPETATALLQDWSAEFGLSPEQVADVASVAASDEVADIIAANTRLVEESIHTVKIPSIIFDGRRHDGLVSVDDLE